VRTVYLGALDVIERRLHLESAKRRQDLTILRDVDAISLADAKQQEEEWSPTSIDPIGKVFGGHNVRKLMPEVGRCPVIVEI
jgi:hypothetical protein